MADNKHSSNALPWYDYQQEVPVPNHVTHLRIGVQQAQAAAANGTAPEIMDLSDALGPNILQQVQIHVHTVRSIPQMSFGCCPNLEQVEFVVSTGESSTAAAAANTAMANTSHSSVQSSRLTRIGNGAFNTCRKLHSVIGLEHVSQSLKIISDTSFGCCRNLTSLDLSCLTQLQYLSRYAIHGCTSLTEVDLSSSVRLEFIEFQTFGDCKALRTIHLPPNLKRIASNAFEGCSALESLVIPASLETMGQFAFQQCSSLTRVTFQSTSKLEWVHGEAFWGCSALESLVIPASVETMGQCTFQHCFSLTRVAFQSTRHLRTLLNDNQFHDCTSLHTLELQGPTIPRKLWPRLLERFWKRGRGILFLGGIRKRKQHLTIAWNFMRANITNFYLEDKKPAYSRKRDILSMAV